MMRRQWLAMVAIACGCNTCLDPASISYMAQDATQPVDDMGDPDDARTAADLGPDTSCSDTTDYCGSRVCGETTATDTCGVQQTVDCGSCGEGGTCSAAGVCSCAAGFELVDQRCSDVDECTVGTDDCQPAEFCINSPGTWTCSDCPLGQEKNASQVCVDIDECDRGTDNCDPLVSCTNADPLFVCGACPAGYTDVNGDGSECDDVDECATNVDDCDTNATCTNTAGSFNCVCNIGWFGSGRTCSQNPATSLVVSVQQASLSLGGGSASFQLPASVVAGQAVAFATATNSGVEGKPEAMHVDVWVEGQRVQAVRASDDGSASVEISVVEFGAATVQRGVFSLGTTQSVPISTVDPTRAFVVFSNEIDGLTNDGRSNTRVRATLNANDVTFSRSGSNGTASGHFAVVSAPMGMSVQHATATIAGSTACGIVATTAPSDRSFILYSSQGGETLGSTLDPSGTHAQCTLKGPGVECCRGNGSPPLGADEITMNVQVVTFDASTNGAVPFRGGTVAAQPAISTLAAPVDLSYTMVTSGTLGALGAGLAESDMSSDSEGAAFITVQLVADDEVEVARGQTTNTPVESFWEVVTWPH